MLVVVPVNEGFVSFAHVVAVSVLGHFTTLNETTIDIGEVVKLAVSFVAWGGFRLIRIIIRSLFPL